jgi:hypothetical protein
MKNLMETLFKRVMPVLQAGILVFVVFMAALSAGAAENETVKEDSQKEQAQLQALQALNQIAVSLTHILTYNDKVVLDQEYNTIINNLNLSKIPDEAIINLLQELMDLLTTSKIQEHERAYLAQTYEKNVQNELKKRMTSRFLDTDLLVNPYSSVLQAVLNVGSFYFNYRYKLEDYKKERDEALWKIDANTLQKLNEFYKKLLKYSWELMRRYNFPDEWRLNEKQLNDYINILKEPNVELRYRKLERLEENFQKFPPYWYYRGQAAQELGNKKEALYCFNRFQAIHQGMLRKDPYAASTAMCKTMLLMDSEDTPPEEIKRDLEVILANSEDADWGNILFAALQYARLGDSEKASKLIMRNLDNGYMSFVDDPDMIRSIGPALLLNIRQDVFTRILDKVLKNDKIKNYDVLWLYGKLRNRDILKRIEPEFDHVLLLTENKSILNPLNIFRADDLSLFLPTRWMAENTAIVLRLLNETGERQIKPSDVALFPNFPNITVITFKNVLSSKKVIKQRQPLQIAIALKHERLAGDKTDKEAYDIEMIFKAEVMPEWQQSARISYYAAYLFPQSTDSKSKTPKKAPGLDWETKKDKAEEKDKGDPAIWFAKERLLVNGEAFKWTDDGVVFDSK